MPGVQSQKESLFQGRLSRIKEIQSGFENLNYKFFSDFEFCASKFRFISKRSKTVKCPVCGSLDFFVKDPDDQYETFDFELKGESVVFKPEAAESNPEVKPDTEVFCERCSWHDKFQQLKKS